MTNDESEGWELEIGDWRLENRDWEQVFEAKGVRVYKVR
jgi:hypothetical protein